MKKDPKRHSEKRKRGGSSSLLGMLLISLGINIYFLEHIIYDVNFSNMVAGLVLQDFILEGRPYHLLIIGLVGTGVFLLLAEVFRLLSHWER